MIDIMVIDKNTNAVIIQDEETKDLYELIRYGCAEKKSYLVLSRIDEDELLKSLFSSSRVSATLNKG